MRKYLAASLVIFLALALACPVPAQAQGTMTLTITGKIAKTAQGYVIQSDTAQIFTILNARPRLLKKLAAGQKTLTIEAESVVGDNVNILSINGKAYK